MDDGFIVARWETVENGVNEIILGAFGGLALITNSRVREMSCGGGGGRSILGGRNEPFCNAPRHLHMFALSPLNRHRAMRIKSGRNQGGIRRGRPHNFSSKLSSMHSRVKNSTRYLFSYHRENDSFSSPLFFLPLPLSRFGCNQFLTQRMERQRRIISCFRDQSRETNFNAESGRQTEGNNCMTRTNSSQDSRTTRFNIDHSARVSFPFSLSIGFPHLYRPYFLPSILASIPLSRLSRYATGS